MCKNLEFFVKTIVVEGFAGCVRERKRYHESIKNDNKILSILIRNQCNTYARTSDAKNIECHQNGDPKGNPQL